MFSCFFERRYPWPSSNSSALEPCRCSGERYTSVDVPPLEKPVDIGPVEDIARPCCVPRLNPQCGQITDPLIPEADAPLLAECHHDHLRAELLEAGEYRHVRFPLPIFIGKSLGRDEVVCQSNELEHPRPEAPGVQDYRDPPVPRLPGSGQ